MLLRDWYCGYETSDDLVKNFVDMFENEGLIFFKLCEDLRAL